MTRRLFQQIAFLHNPPHQFATFFRDFNNLCRKQCSAVLTDGELDFKTEISSGIDDKAVAERLTMLNNFSLSLVTSLDAYKLLCIVGTDAFYQVVDLGVCHFHDEEHYLEHPSQLVRTGIGKICLHLTSRCVDEILAAIANRNELFDLVNREHDLTSSVKYFQEACSFNTSRWQVTLQIFCDQAENTIGFESALRLTVAWIADRPDLLADLAHLGPDYGDKVFRICYGLKSQGLTTIHRTELTKLLATRWDRAIPAIVDLLVIDEASCRQLLYDSRSMVRGAAAMIGIEQGYLERDPKWHSTITELLSTDLRPIHDQRAKRALRLLG